MKKRDDIYLREIESRSEKIASHLKKLNYQKFIESDLHRSAIIRELEVIGEAANKISAETRAQFKSVPWDQMIGMRNRLIHGYFDVDHSIVWEVAKKEIPNLIDPIRKAILITSPSLHPWRVCPAGYYHVRKHPRSVGLSNEHPTGETSVREHCRRNPSGKDQLYPREMEEIFQLASKDVSKYGQLGVLDSSSDNNFDTKILVWTKYWNDIFEPKVLLEPNIVKALLGSESSFGRNSKDTKVSKGNFARGPFQITDQTRKILSDEKGELKDHFLTVTAKDIKNPIIATAAAIRWLFQKKKLASIYLGREATWEESIAEYKGYLRRKKPFNTQRGMEVFQNFLTTLRSKK